LISHPAALTLTLLLLSPPLGAASATTAAAGAPVQPAANPAQLAEPNGAWCVTASSQLDGAPVTQTRCGHLLGLAAGQIWDFRTTPEGGFQIVNLQSGKCLEVSAAPKPGLAIQNPCKTKDRSRQLWELQASGGPPAVVRLVNRSGGKCLQVPGSSVDADTQFVLNPCKTSGPGWIDQFYVIAELPPVK
jgi:hypothetical protein